ncbi:MAG: EF-hand domain-containing protein [Gemmataceae bacterium]
MIRHFLMFVCLLALVFQVSAAAEDQAPKRKKGDLPKGNAADFIKRFDKNNDGKIDKSEAPERMAQFFDRIDANKDGKLDEKEVDQMLQRLRQNAGNPGEFLKRAMEKLDANKDGKISKAEAKGPLEQNFDRLDANKDGFLDKDELSKVAARFGNRPDNADRPRGDAAPARNEDFPFFDAMDKNADGRLTKEELQNQPKILEAFAAIDTSKDGKIDPKEYEAFLKTQKKE